MSRDFVLTQALQTLDQLVSDQQQALSQILVNSFSEYNSNPDVSVVTECLSNIDSLLSTWKPQVSELIGVAVDAYAIEQGELSGTMTDVELEVIIENETRPLFNKIDLARVELTKLLETIG